MTARLGKDVRCIERENKPGSQVAAAPHRALSLARTVSVCVVASLLSTDPETLLSADHNYSVIGFFLEQLICLNY